jgi:hypothetical protein
VHGIRALDLADPGRSEAQHLNDMRGGAERIGKDLAALERNRRRTLLPVDLGDQAIPRRNVFAVQARKPDKRLAVGSSGPPDRDVLRCRNTFSPLVRAPLALSPKRTPTSPYATSAAT